MSKKKILLIEDNEDIRENTSEILVLANYEVHVAENGKKGVEAAMEFLPDLIICDIMMPELDGYGVLHAIQRNDKIKNTPFIFLTAKSERDDFRKGMESGADDYIAKPFGGIELLNTVDRRLKKIEWLREEAFHDIDGLVDLVNVSTGKNPWHSLTEGRSTDKYKKKQIIYAEGNRPHNIYYVVSGKVKTYKANDDGKELVTNLYTTGDFFGHIALIEGKLYWDTAETLEDSELVIIPKTDFDRLINTDKEVAMKFIQILAENVSFKESQLLAMAYNSLRKKVADALLMVRKKYDQDKEVKFSIDMTRESLANIAGTATESLVRTLSDFKNEKLIDIVDGKITLLDQEKLENLVN
ncbi:MAG TPA: response regulator [Saprospiraceae bacterium]|nr:response regulator [Saprospiraceae bacterium]